MSTLPTLPTLGTYLAVLVLLELELEFFFLVYKVSSLK